MSDKWHMKDRTVLPYLPKWEFGQLGPLKWQLPISYLLAQVDLRDYIANNIALSDTLSNFLDLLRSIGFHSQAVIVSLFFVIHV